MKLTKVLLTFAFVTMLLSGVSFAQDGAISSGTGRYEALGSNPFIWDAAIDMNNNPAWAAQYKNYLFGDIGRNVVSENELTDQYFGVNFGLSKQISLGAVLNKREDRWDEFGNPYGIQSPIVPMKILFAVSTDNFTFGAAPYLALWSKEVKPAGQGDTNYSSSSIGGQLGFIWNLDKQSFIEGAFDIKINSYKYEVTNVTTPFKGNNEGGLQFAANFRGKFNVQKQYGISLVPYVGFGTYSWNPTESPLPTPNTVFTQYSNFNVQGGIGINMPVMENGLFGGGISAGYRSFKGENWLTGGDEYKYTAFTLPKFNLGLEWKFVDWLVGRVGYSRAMISTDDKYSNNGLTDETSLTIASDPIQTINLGLGMQFGRFSLDGTIGEKLLKNSPYVISGQTNDLYGVISASYNFKK
jgi:hypothetical protein